MSPDDLNRRRGILEAHGVSSAESALLHAVNYYSGNTPCQLPNYAQWERYTLDKPVTETACQDALVACLVKGWLRVIDEPDRAEIRDDLQRDGIFGPVHGLPPVGGVDFTPDGADRWLRLARDLFGRPTPYWCMHSGRGKRELYCRDYDAALRHAQRLSALGAVVSEPQEIGPWRVQWWRRFEWGYRLDVDSPYQGDTFWRREKPSSPPFAYQERLWQALVRRGVALGEYHLLSVIDSHADKRPHALAARSPSLQSCLDKGWVQILDDRAIGRIHDLLRDDPTEVQLGRFVGRVGHVDFTPAGAALYQSISAETFWPDWDADLYVERLCSWLEHSYSESDEYLQQRFGQRCGQGARVLAVRIEALGPWCARWWQRFPSGYRHDAEFGSLG